MRTTLFTLLICTGVTFGCGGGGGGETATDTTTTNPSGTTTNPSTTDPGGTTTTSPTSGTDTTTPGTETTAEPPVTSSTTPVTETGPGETTVGETGPGETTVGETGPGETTVGESTAGESTTGDPPIGGQCTKNSDCVLISDCCRCEAASVDDPVPECPDIQCLIPQCDALNIDEVECRFGQCVTEKLNCDAAAIACDQAPPVCEPGQLPGVNEDNTCWTGGCVPIASCNVVPACSDCPDDQMCVTDDTMLGPKVRCEPIPAECVVKPNCECAGDACDNGPNMACMEQADGLHCSCPMC
jgi:hypothetical protein